MSIEIKVPVFPESISEGEIATWHKASGDPVAEGDVLVEIETDKVVMEVPAAYAGVMGDIVKNEGDTVASEEIIGHMIQGDAAALPAAKEEAPAEKKASKPTATESQHDASPAVRRILAEREISAGQVTGTGKGGRLTVQDVKDHADGGESKAAKAAPVASLNATSGRVEERVKMTRLRRTIAKRLLEVQQTSAMLTTFNEVDMKPVMDLRKKYKDQFEKKFGVRLGFMSFFLKAATEALKQFPAVNASIDGDELVYHGYFDIGVAVSSPRGLVVPVVRNVDQLGLAGIEESIRGFAGKAKEGTLAIEDMQGGTFTVTNGGVFGSLLSTPILNPPQTGILGMHKIQDRPMAVDGEIVIQPMMYLALTYDHRIIDGKTAVQFLVAIKDLIEDPARILLQL